VTISLSDWTKFYDVITKPLPIASSLFLLGATSFLLFGSPSSLNRLGLSHAVEYRWVVGFLFIIAATWIVVTALIVISKRGHQEWSKWWVKKKGQRRLHALTADERRILSGYVMNEVRTQIFTAAPDIGAAQALANDGVLYRPDVMQGEPVAVPYNIYEWALDYLSKNRGLVAAVVSAKTRWSHTGRWQVVGRGIGKVLLAIALAYAGFMFASLVGGFLAGVIGAIFHLRKDTIDSLAWTLPKIIFLGILVGLYVWDKRRRAAV
jgi:hypothetical protein